MSFWKTKVGKIFKYTPIGAAAHWVTGGGDKPPEQRDLSAAAGQDYANSQRDVASQTQNNRINQSGPGGYIQYGPDGSQTSGFAPGLQPSWDTLMSQWQQALAQPVQDGQAARQQAIDSAYGEAQKRLDPQWAKYQEMERTRLINQGLDPGSEASRGAMTELGNARNDAYGSAMSSAIQQGTAAGESVFRQNLAARNLPLEQMQQMQGLLKMPDYNVAGRADSSKIFEAARTMNDQELARYLGVKELEAQRIRIALDAVDKVLKASGSGGAGAAGAKA